jgi:hypothetical protein
MQPRQLRALIETGHYESDPSLVAEAMLQRRGVRALLIDSQSPLDATSRTQWSRAAGHRAA